MTMCPRCREQTRAHCWITIGHLRRAPSPQEIAATLPGEAAAAARRLLDSMVSDGIPVCQGVPALKRALDAEMRSRLMRQTAYGGTQ